MDALDPRSFRHFSALLSTGRTYHFVDQLPSPVSPSAPTILCIHGFPDSWYGWRHQIAPWVRRGFRVVAPDMLGYGATDKPRDPAAYSTRRLSDDLAALLDHLSIRSAIVAGHDWGSYTAGRFALWHPDRLMSVPFTPPSPKHIPLADAVRRNPAFAYQAYFADPASASEIEANLPRFLDAMYGRIRADEPLHLANNMRRFVLAQIDGARASKPYVSDAEIAHAADQLRDMHGPLCYYRTTQARFEEEHAARLPLSLPPTLPVLFIYGTRDPTSTPERHRAPDGSGVVRIEGAGHWVLLQAREVVVREVVGWVERMGVAPVGGRGEGRARL
ncbi:alpha/beta-hydrolase [Vararia minispora EC-137]|uniref:Alpha/beta-hydrolase n=1 Tax=Vararia minispora EC-137 TaxID=1314806 RepID=A0ACB8QGT7_9AGAM|nr:alpha/beta-hydrolase [Vararia minispora EC-137]